jgi:hypothetical protein
MKFVEIGGSPTLKTSKCGVEKYTEMLSSEWSDHPRPGVIGMQRRDEILVKTKYQSV